jgi:hypothetical protein
VKVLFFAPHSAIWQHAFPEALVAEALQQRGHEIVYVTCGERFRTYCVPMSAYGVRPEAPSARKRAVCVRCNRSKMLIRKNLGLKGYDLADRLSSRDIDTITELVRSTTHDNFFTLQVDGINVGRMALYQLLLRHKKIALEFDQHEWGEYLLDLENTLYSHFASRNILDSERPDRVVVYNGLYSVNRVCCKLAENRGISAYFLHAGGNWSNRLQKFILARDNTYSFMKSIIARWPDYRYRACSRELLKKLTDHFLVLFAANSIFVYSAAKGKGSADVRGRFGISSEQKILVAAMGSYDEEFAAEIVEAKRPIDNLVFTTQVSWLQALVRFARQHPELFLIIRVHPREFPNKREAKKSEHAEMLETLFKTLPSNVAINWPADRISIYDLADEADVFLNSWSSVGKEMSVLGLPVVIYSAELPLYPAELNYLGTSEADYFDKIERALKDGWSIENSRKAFRWLAVEYDYALIDISESYFELETQNKNLVSRAAGRLRRSIDAHYKERSDLKLRAPRLRSAGQIEDTIEANSDSVLDRLRLDPDSAPTLEQETGYIENELRRLRLALYDNTPAGPENTLSYRLLHPYSRARA